MTLMLARDIDQVVRLFLVDDALGDEVFGEELIEVKRLYAHEFTLEESQGPRACTPICVFALLNMNDDRESMTYEMRETSRERDLIEGIMVTPR